MIVQTIKVNNCNPQTIVIGRRGTYDTIQIAFDLSYLVEFYGNGVAVLAVKRSQDESAYPAVVTQEDNTLTWTVSETDTYYVGAGEAQLMWYVDGGLAKTIIYPMVVMKDILMTSEEAPDAYQTWVDDLTALGAETLQNAQKAAQSATEAKASEDNAAESARKAEEAAGMLVGVSATATTLEPGESATAEYNDGFFEFGIPEGEKGDPFTYEDFTEAQKAELVQGPILDAQTAAVEAVNAAGTTQTGNVNQAGTSAVNAVNQAGTTQVNAVNQAGATQVQAVEDKGDEVIDSIPSDYSDLTAEVNDLTRHLNDLEDTVSTTQIINTASGAIASFDDGADGQPIRKLVAQIEPVQDLHGYANPWPAGGNGNKWNEDWEAGAINVITGALSSPSNAIRSASYSACTPSTEYYLFCGAGSSRWFLGLCWYDANQQFISGSYNNRGTVTSPENAAYFKITTNTSDSIYGGTYNNDIAVNYPSAITTYSPYSNICPISGHTGAEATRTGKNLVNSATITTNGYIRAGNASAQSPLGSFVESGTWSCSDYIKVNANTQYTTSVPAFDSVGGAGLVYYDSDKNAISGVPCSTQGGAVYSFTTPNNCQFVRFSWPNTNGNNAQLEAGSTATAYEPYTGNQISVTFPTTIYGGEDEAISGKLVSDMGDIPDLGTLTWTKYDTAQGTLFRAAVPSIKKIANTAGKIKLLCSAYPYVAQNVRSDKTCSIPTNSANVDIIDNRYSDAESFKAAMSGVQLCYELAESVEYDLAPQSMTTIYGANNIWSSTGDTEVEYPCDTKLYIDNKITQAIAAALNA